MVHPLTPRTALFGRFLLHSHIQESANRNLAEHNYGAGHDPREMSKRALDIGPVSNTEAFNVAEHWRRYAHRPRLVFQNRQGEWFCLRYCREAIKRAMLAVGTRGYMYINGEGHPAKVGWRGACVRLRNAAYIHEL